MTFLSIRLTRHYPNMVFLLHQHSCNTPPLHQGVLLFQLLISYIACRSSQSIIRIVVNLPLGLFYKWLKFQNARWPGTSIPAVTNNFSISIATFLPLCDTFTHGMSLGLGKWNPAAMWNGSGGRRVCGSCCVAGR